MNQPPCSGCPWVSGKPEDVAATTRPAVSEAAMNGQVFVCHKGTGNCRGVALWIAKQLASPASSLTQ